MDDARLEPSQSLYDEDFYAWTQQQALLLREGLLAEADIANILEEIESLGRREASALRSRYKVLALHLLKQMFQPERSARSWTTTIVDQRLEIERHMKENPSLKARADELFAQGFQDARRLAAAETGLPLATFPAEPPFTREQALDDAYRP